MVIGDDDDTERGRRRLSTQDRLVLESARRQQDEDEITSPIDLLLCEDVAQDADPVERLRRDSRDPYSLIYNLAEALTREKQRERSSDRTRADQLMQLLDRAPNQAALALQADVVALKKEAERRARSRKWLWGVAGTVLVAALGALSTGVGLMISRAEHEGEYRTKLQRLEQDVQQLLHKGTP